MKATRNLMSVCSVKVLKLRPSLQTHRLNTRVRRNVDYSVCIFPADCDNYCEYEYSLQILVVTTKVRRSADYPTNYITRILQQVL